MRDMRSDVNADLHDRNATTDAQQNAHKERIRLSFSEIFSKLTSYIEATPRISSKVLHYCSRGYTLLRQTHALVWIFWQIAFIWKIFVRNMKGSELKIPHQAKLRFRQENRKTSPVCRFFADWLLLAATSSLRREWGRVTGWCRIQGRPRCNENCHSIKKLSGLKCFWWKLLVVPVGLKPEDL